MAGSLYGPSIITETSGVLCLKLLGCIVAILQESYGVTNVDEYLSITDIAFLIHKGGVLASTVIQHEFKSALCFIFSGGPANKLGKQTVDNNSSIGAYRLSLLKQTQHRISMIVAQVVVSSEFANDVAIFRRPC